MFHHSVQAISSSALAARGITATTTAFRRSFALKKACITINASRRESGRWHLYPAEQLVGMRSNSIVSIGAVGWQAKQFYSNIERRAWKYFCSGTEA